MHTTQPQEAGSVDHAKTHTHNHTHTHTRAHKQTRRHTKTLIYNDRCTTNPGAQMTFNAAEKKDIGILRNLKETNIFA